MSSQKLRTPEIINSLSQVTPGVSFRADKTFYWSPEHQLVCYKNSQLGTPEGLWSLVHEVAHAKLGHSKYDSDFELLSLEVAAWEEAKLLAKTLRLEINEGHIQDCLDTYRDWLHKRSTCPTCGTVGLQHSQSEYRCHNCNQPWSVTTARFCRPYRKKTSAKIQKPTTTTFR